MKKALLCTLPVLALAGIGGFFLYPRPAPQFGWLVFGPEARVRVLVCMRGEAVALDLYVDGLATGRSDRFRHPYACQDIAITDPDGLTTYVITRMSGEEVQAGVPTGLLVQVKVQGSVEYGQSADLVALAPDREAAPVAHFHGPLTVQAQTLDWKLPPGLVLRRSATPMTLRALVGTLDAEQGCWVVVRSENSGTPTFTNGVHPVVDITFPPGNPGGPPVTRPYTLDQVC